LTSSFTGPTQGSGVNKLHDALGVKVDFSDEADEKEKEAGKKKKAAVHQKSKVKVVAHFTYLSSPHFSLYLQTDYRSQGECRRSQNNESYHRLRGS
jgi:hypothetical protein